LKGPSWPALLAPAGAKPGQKKPAQRQTSNPTRNSLSMCKMTSGRSCPVFVNGGKRACPKPPLMRTRVYGPARVDGAAVVAGGERLLPRMLVPEDCHGDQNYRDNPQHNVFAAILLFSHVRKYSTDTDSVQVFLCILVNHRCQLWPCIAQAPAFRALRGALGVRCGGVHFKPWQAPRLRTRGDPLRPSQHLLNLRAQRCAGNDFPDTGGHLAEAGMCKALRNP
jgi:hypothetical protein